MCGRYRRTSDKQRIAEAFHVKAGLENLSLSPDDDIAPGSIQPVIRLNEDGDRFIETMRWGFRLPDRFLFNARSEEIDTARFWKESFIKRRCIVPADSVFEWEKEAAGKKPKYEITLPGREPFGMAGLWQLWKNPKTGIWENTFAVMTGAPNKFLSTIHPRLTTFLEQRDYAEYLAPSERAPVHLLRILPEEGMRVRLIEKSPITDRQATLFDPQ